VRALLDLESDDHYHLYASTRLGRLGPRIDETIRRHSRAVVSERLFPARLLKLLAAIPGVGVETLLGEVDVFHHTDLMYLPVKRSPQVVTVHDLAFEVDRGFHGRGFAESARRRLKSVLSRAAAVVVPSRATRSDLITRYGVPAEQVVVIPHGVDHVARHVSSRSAAAENVIPESPFALFIGTVEPRKNLVRLLKAFAIAAGKDAELSLLIAGRRGWETGPFLRELRQHRWRARIGWREDAADEELVALCCASRFLVYPSLYEGFGLPVGEAMWLGTPVITSSRSSLPEIAGDAALLVDPEDVEDLAGAMLKLNGDEGLRRRLSELGRAQSSQFTWRRSAEMTAAVYRRVAARERVSNPLS